MRFGLERLFEATGLPRDAAGNALRVHLEGNRELSVSGVQAVREYTLARVRLQVEGGRLHLHGAGLELSSIGEGVARIKGRIEQIELLMEDE